MVETRSLPKAMSFCLSLHTVHKYLKLHSYGVILSLATVVLRRFTVLAYLKCFVGLCKDRLEGLMGCRPAPHSRRTAARSRCWSCCCPTTSPGWCA